MRIGRYEPVGQLGPGPGSVLKPNFEKSVWSDRVEKIGRNSVDRYPVEYQRRNSVGLERSVGTVGRVGPGRFGRVGSVGTQSPSISGNSLSVGRSVQVQGLLTVGMVGRSGNGRRKGAKVGRVGISVVEFGRIRCGRKVNPVGR